MRYIVSLSGGVSSAVAADRVIAVYGVSKVTLWFADTLIEDADLYRFLADCLKRWGNSRAARWLMKRRKLRPDGRTMTRKIGNFIYHTEGKTPEWIAREKRIIPNQKVAPCTYELKIKPFIEWLDKLRGQGTFTICLGYNVDETHRTKKRYWWHRYNGKPRKPQGYARRFAHAHESYPLLWQPEIWDGFTIVRRWGIEIPKLYREGFSNNNCGGKCWRGGLRHWARLRVIRPKSYAHVQGFETMMQERHGIKHTILRDQSGGAVTPMTLATFANRVDAGEFSVKPPVFQEDLFACICAY